MKKVLLVGMARQRSTRCVNKMTRPFADTTLFDIYLDKLDVVVNKLDNPFSKAIVAVNRNDEILWNKAYYYRKISLEERPDTSIAPDSVLSSNFSFLNNYKEDYVMWVNGCFPFLKPETILHAVNLFVSNKDLKSLHCVKQIKNWFWDEHGKPITIRDKKLSRTQDSIPLFESVHCFHIFDRKYLLDNCAYWDFTKNNPFLYVINDGVEFLDIDTDMDFKICESLWRDTHEYKKS